MANGLSQHVYAGSAGTGGLVKITGLDGGITVACVSRGECYVQIGFNPPTPIPVAPVGTPAPSAGTTTSWEHLFAAEDTSASCQQSGAPGSFTAYVAIWSVTTGDVQINVSDIGSASVASVAPSGTAAGITLADSAGNFAAGTANVETALANAASTFAADGFGDGSDGVGAFDGSTVVAGITPSTSVYTVDHDLFLASGTVSPLITVKTNGFRIFCQGLLTVQSTGVISCDGNAAALSVAGIITNTSGSLGVGTAGGAGATSDAAGTAGGNQTQGLPGGTGAGGQGGGGPHTGAAGGTYTTATAVMGGIRMFGGLSSGLFMGTGSSGTASLLTPLQGGAGGAGGSGDGGSAVGGGGGGGGGVLILAARNLVNNGAIHANGGAGAAATGTTNVGGGGGGGGGTVIVLYRNKSGAGTVTATGGAGGAKAGTGTVGHAGANGNVLQVAA